MTTDTTLIRETFPVGPLQCNCTIIGDRLTGKAIVIDPGGNPQVIMATLQALNLRVEALIHTHAHFDHFLASGDIKKQTSAPIHLHKEDKFLWDNLELQCKMFNAPYHPVPDPDFWLEDEQELPCCQGVSIHTPGHTPGSMSFWFEKEKLLIAGDTLFRRSIGRTDLWGGDFKTIKKSIYQKLYVLDEETVVVTGHGPETSIGEEIRGNSVLRG
ncbi:MAG: MBL fold metallo-hydrolase [Candidatus Endonucleobacter bathymodioli]|uniref:MBL fold metallo-hydrolase n=1 Tax=Candidatus Endonucleibacter bathymodioli TaxID=539814 RepID=A0AA90NK09_9GAMM|nr:MBL fold metallo-hydrolase [Candidatus Endonucleobacter bathymodioli]